MKVLIIDDDVVSRMVLMHLVDSACAGRCEVLEAEDGEDGWRQLDGGAGPALVFCDLRMPRLSGMELLARTRADARFAALPFVLVSAAGDGASMEQALGLGVDGYVVKPFDADQVRVHLARAGLLDELPDATTRRLGIDAVRLLLYLGGLQRQLEDAAPALARLLAGQETEAARLLMTRLRDGCRTLGLAGAEAGLDAVLGGPSFELAQLARALDAACVSALRQADVVRELLA